VCSRWQVTPLQDWWSLSEIGWRSILTQSGVGMQTFLSFGLMSALRQMSSFYVTWVPCDPPIVPRFVLSSCSIEAAKHVLIYTSRSTGVHASYVLGSCNLLENVRRSSHRLQTRRGIHSRRLDWLSVIWYLSWKVMALEQMRQWLSTSKNSLREVTVQRTKILLSGPLHLEKGWLGDTGGWVCKTCGYQTYGDHRLLLVLPELCAAWAGFLYTFM
jgi:hypothetical protein